MADERREWIDPDTEDGTEAHESDVERRVHNRRQSFGRRREDLQEIALLSQRMTAIEAKMEAVAVKLDQQTELITCDRVQNEKIAHILSCMSRIKEEQTEQWDAISRQAERITLVQSGHDRCSNLMIADLKWVKWFVMGNSTALFGMILGFIFAFLKG